MNTESIREDDVVFLHNAKEALNAQRTRGSTVMIFTIVAMIVAFALWANTASLEEVTNGPGKVIPSTAVQTIQNLEGGIVSEILAKEGDIVEKGQLLVRIDDTMSTASYEENAAQRDSL